MIENGIPCSLVKPKILLLAGALSCHRDNTHGHVDLESLAAMEDDYLRSICGKIKSFKPDLVLVETTITQKAQVRKTSLMPSFGECFQFKYVVFFSGGPEGARHRLRIQRAGEHHGAAEENI